MVEHGNLIQFNLTINHSILITTLGPVDTNFKDENQSIDRLSHLPKISWLETSEFRI